MTFPTGDEKAAAYQRFLDEKVVSVPMRGFEISEADVNPACKPHVRAIVPWMVRLGRAACFSRFGLMKTSTQLEAVRLTRERSGGRGLIVCPLGVRQEFRRDAVERLGWKEPPRFIRTTAEATDPEGLYLTNYESVREGKIDPLAFDVASLDEAAVLRGFGGSKTFREFMRLFAGDDRSGTHTRGVPFRYVATATPSPNEYIELLAYAAYLEVMDVSAAKTRFFKRDSTKADNLTLHPHKEQEFWLWVASWAMFLQRPSDLGPGYSDEGYTLPPIDVRWHELRTDHASAGADRDGQGRMFKNAAMGVTEAAREKRESIGTRVAKMVEIIGHGLQGHGEEGSVVPSVLRRAEGSVSPAAAGLEGGQPGEVLGLGGEEPRGESRATERAAAGEVPDGRGISDTPACERSHDATEEVRVDAGRLAGRPRRARGRLRDLRGERAGDTDGGGPRSPDGGGEGPPLRAVQQGAGNDEGRSGSPTGGGGVPDQVVIWCDLNSEQRAVELALDDLGVSYSTLYGSIPLEERERRLDAWRRGETTVLIGKPVLIGSGVNLQQSAHAIFVGVDFKFNDWIQAVHRQQRYGQSRRVRIDLIYTEAEREVRLALEQKWKQHELLVENMSAIIREFGLAGAALAGGLSRSMGVLRVEASGPGYRLVNNDAVVEAMAMPAESVGLIVTSIPFAHQYEYSPSFNDFGHTDDFDHFWEQMDFLTPELLRVLQPGRVAAVHVKDRITPGGINGLGFQTVHPLSDETIAHFRKHGFAFLGRKTVVTDVVRENAQTYRLGWTEQCKDGSRMGTGLPEYVLLFRKPQTDRSRGFADVPVVKQKDEYSRGRWQFDAHGFTRSNGDRPLSIEDLKGLTHAQVFKLFRKYSLTRVYDFERDVAIAEWLDGKGMLPPSFMLLQPQSWHPDVWTDITRMRTLNMLQERKGLEQHLCPLQFDIADRLIVQFSMPGETVFDPFGGLMTVPYCAIRKGRNGLATELNPSYFADGAAHCAAAARDLAMPTLFDIALPSAETDAGDDAQGCEDIEQPHAEPAAMEGGS